MVKSLSLGFRSTDPVLVPQKLLQSLEISGLGRGRGLRSGSRTPRAPQRPSCPRAEASIRSGGYSSSLSGQDALWAWGPWPGNQAGGSGPREVLEHGGCAGSLRWGCGRSQSGGVGMSKPHEALIRPPRQLGGFLCILIRSFRHLKMERFHIKFWV